MATVTIATARPGRRGNIDEFRDALISDYTARNASPSTINTVTVVFRALTEAGITRITELNDDGVARFQTFLNSASHLADRTRNQYLGMLRRFCDKGLELGILRKKPAFPVIVHWSAFANIKEPPRLSHDDASRLLRHLEPNIETWKGHRIYALIVTGMFTGLLRNELLALRVDDLDLEKGLVTVRRRQSSGSSLRPSIIELGDKPKAVLKAWVPLTGCEWLFPGVERKAPWGLKGRPPHGAGDQVVAVGAAVGIHGLSFLSLRKFYEENVRLPSLSHLEGLISEQARPAEPAVKIGGPNDPVFIRGRSKGVLTPTQYAVIKLLWDAWRDGGLSRKQLNDSSLKGAWRITLRRLKQDPDWDSAIAFPGRGYPGQRDTYRILPC